MIKVLFVCTGNICRSSMAEGFFRHEVEGANLSQHIECDSAGLIDYHTGNSPDGRAKQHMRSLGIDISRQRSRQVEPEELAATDYILAMDRGHFEALQQMVDGDTQQRIAMMMEHGMDATVTDVPDPYYSDAAAFAYVAELLQPAARGLLQVIRRAL